MKRDGFTLIEIMVTMVLIGILSSGVFMMMRSARKQAAIAQTTTQVQGLAGLLEMYKNQYGNYPRVTASYLDNNDEPIGYSCLEFHFISGEGDDVRLNAGDCKLTKAGSGLTFKIKDGTSTRTVKNAGYTRGDPDEMTFGLASHLLPRATIIAGATWADQNVYDYYRAQFNSPNEDTPYGLENVLTGNCKALNVMQVQENLDTRLYDEWRRLEKDGIVYAQANQDPDTGTERYSAGAKNDAWGTPLVYRNEGGAGEIVSAGADKIFGTADDITSGGGAVDEEDDD